MYKVIMSKRDKIVAYCKKQPGVHSRRELVDAGAYPALIRKLVSEDILEEVSRGYYRLVGQEVDFEGLATVAKIVPQGVFCLLSALSYHNIGTQNPHEYHIAIPKSKWIPDRPEFTLQVYQFGDKAYQSGIETHGVIKVYSIAKTVADCFKFRNQIGLDVALEALKDALKNKKVKVSEIIDQAEVCRVRNVMMPYLESMA